MFAWKLESIPDYWACTQRMMEWGDEVGPDLIVDDGGDATLFVHLGVEWEEKFEATGELPNPADGTCEDERELYQLIKNCIVNSKTK